MKDKKIVKLETIGTTQENIEGLRLAYVNWKIYNLYCSKEKEVTRINKNGKEITQNISYILQFINSARFMASSLSNLVNNFSEGIHRIKCKYRHDDKMWHL